MGGDQPRPGRADRRAAYLLAPTPPLAPPPPATQGRPPKPGV